MNVLHLRLPRPRLASSLVAVGLAAVIGASCARTHAGAGPAAVTAATPFDRVVRDVCDKRIVLLGEDANHGGGGTLAAKTALVTRLIDECQFSAVVFEASLAEFVDLNRAFAAGNASPAHVADAIGGLWSVARESDPLIAALFERAQRKQVVLAGLDGQIGSTNLYVQAGLTDELAGYLANPRRSACHAELQRHARWEYHDASPFDGATRERLRQCLTEIEAAASGRAQSTPAEEAAAMAIAWRSAIEAFDSTLSSSAGFNTRDRAMYQALQWHVTRLPQDSKIIIWCATVHAAKDLRGVPELAELIPLGSYVHRDFGEAAAAIGISALGGSFGRPKSPATGLVPAPADSLEARAFASEGSSDVGYLGRADLAKFGSGTARALNYSRLTDAPWHEIIDGLLVLRQERTPTYVHNPKPRRTNPPAQ
ncbi:MAG: erythromycin esterase family protein [Myxococcota bacterium]